MPDQVRHDNGPYRMRLNQSKDRPADNRASAAAAIAKSAEISVSFFYTVRRELSVSYTFRRSCAVPA